MKKIQYITLRVFFVTMLLCAAIFLYMVWTAAPNGPDEFGLKNQVAFTSFVVGLASFLIWLTTMIVDIRDRMSK